MMSLPAPALLTRVGGVPYYAPTARSSATWAAQHRVFGNHIGSNTDPLPSCLLKLDSLQGLDAQSLTPLVETWLKIDDVFCSEFLGRIFILVQQLDKTWNINAEANRLLQDWKTQEVYVIPFEGLGEEESLPRPGPYFSLYNGLYPAWRLFSDPSAAFVFPVVPAEGDHRTFAIPETAGIPVPSRCFYDKPSPTKPLLGLRVVIKDNIDMAGIPTGVGNKAFATLYGARSKNAACVEKLLDAGAVIIGRVKTVQFASGEGAKDWFDYQAPFNPRGDGYQDPECSSAGSAVACAAYDWVDVAIGTDTIGSIIGPACQQGIFGLRPTLGNISTTGVFPVSKELDTVGIFARTAHVCATVAKAISNTGLPDLSRGSNFQLIYPIDAFNAYPEEYRAFAEPFISKLESFFQTKRSEVDLGARFLQAEVSNQSILQDYLSDTAAQIQLKDCYHNCLPFVQGYREKFKKAPFVDPYIKYKWRLGEEISQEEYDEAINQRNTFRNWVASTIFPEFNDSQTLDRIMVMPNGHMNPIYRHEYDGLKLDQGASKKQGFGFRYPISFVVLAGVPFINVPIGQFPYTSEVTESSEYLPVNIGIIGPKGSEIALLQLIKDFLESSVDLHSSVKSGNTAFAIHKDA